MYLMGTIWQCSNGKALFEKHQQQMGFLIGKWCKQYGTKPWIELNGKALNLFIERAFVIRAANDRTFKFRHSHPSCYWGASFGEMSQLFVINQEIHPQCQGRTQGSLIKVLPWNIFNTFKRPLVCHHLSWQIEFLSGTTLNNRCINPIFIYVTVGFNSWIVKVCDSSLCLWWRGWLCIQPHHESLHSHFLPFDIFSPVFPFIAIYTVDSQYTNNSKQSLTFIIIFDIFCYRWFFWRLLRFWR